MQAFKAAVLALRGRLLAVRRGWQSGKLARWNEGGPHRPAIDGDTGRVEAADIQAEGVALRGGVADRLAVQGGPSFPAVGVRRADRHALLGFSGGPSGGQVLGVLNVPLPTIAGAEGGNDVCGGVAGDPYSGRQVGGDLLGGWIPGQAFGPLAVGGYSEP